MTDDDNLDAYFTAARARPPAPSDDLMARIEAQAMALQPVPQARRAPPQGLWAQVLATLGGWSAVSGLAAATVAGVWFGAYPPELLSDSVSTLLYGADTLAIDPTGGFGFDLTEG